ncbi:MAG: hypothetical protein M3Q29_25410 [Chloroflexota bacterium]|nr:hypothetical protein [Chloroflexota bacterium]
MGKGRGIPKRLGGIRQANSQLSHSTIRTLLNYFLGQELRQEECRRETESPPEPGREDVPAD